MPLLMRLGSECELLADTGLPTTWQSWGALGAVGVFAWLVFKLLVQAKDRHIQYLEVQVDVWRDEAHKWQRVAIEGEQVTKKALSVAKDQTEIVRQVAQVADEGRK